MDSQEASKHVQIRLMTELERFKHANSPFSVPAEVTCKELLSLLKAHLHAYGLLDDGKEQPEFDFLVRGEMLRISIEQYMELNSLSSETVLDIEYILKAPSPTPEQCITHNDWVSCVQANGDVILSGCYDSTVRLVTVQGEELLTIPAHSAPVRCLSWIAAGTSGPQTFVTGSHDQNLHVWEWESAKNSVRCLYKCAGHALSVEAVSVAPDRLQFVSGSRDAMLKIWTMDGRGMNVPGDDVPKKKIKSEAPTKVPIITLSGHHEAVTSVRWHGPGTVYSGSMDHTIRVWDLESQTEKQTITSSKAILCLDCSPFSACILTGSSDRHVRLWDPKVQDGSMVIGNFSSHNGWVSSIMWSRTEEYLFISGSYDNLTKLWDIRSPKSPLYDLTGHEDKVLAVDWTNQKYMLSAGADNCLNVFAYTAS